MKMGDESTARLKVELRGAKRLSSATVRIFNNSVRRSTKISAKPRNRGPLAKHRHGHTAAAREKLKIRTRRGFLCETKNVITLFSMW